MKTALSPHFPGFIFPASATPTVTPCAIYLFTTSVSPDYYVSHP